MIIGVGIDIVDFSRARRLINGKHGKEFLQKNLTAREIEYCQNKISHYATTFAAKEAVFKAFGSGWQNGKDVEILRKNNGQPYVILHGQMKKFVKGKISVSMSYSKTCAIAIAIIQK